MSKPPLEKGSVRGLIIHVATKAALRALPGGFVVEMVGEYVVPRVAKAVVNWMAGYKEEDRAKVVEELAELPASEARKLADEAIEEAEKEEPMTPEQKRVMRDYLAAIPEAIRASLPRDDRTGKSVCPIDMIPKTAADFERILPKRVAPFGTPHDLDGTPYRLIDLAGAGGFGVVYKAINKFEQLRDPVAIKFCLDPQQVITLERERRLLDRMIEAGKQWSDSIVQLYGHHLDAKPPYLIYEWVGAGDLHSYQSKKTKELGRQLSPEEVFDLIKRICVPLALAHQRGLIHRDLKPANVLIASDGTLKLADFGIAASVEPTATNNQSVVRLSGSGTPIYMSEEQRRGEAPDPRHDIFALGVIWFQLLTGEMSAALPHGWERLLERKFNVPRMHIAMMQKCSGWLDERFANAGELLAALKKPPTLPPKLSQPAPVPYHPTVPSTATTSQPSTPPPSSKRPPNLPPSKPKSTPPPLVKPNQPTSDLSVTSHTECAKVTFVIQPENNIAHLTGKAVRGYLKLATYGLAGGKVFGADTLKIYRGYKLLGEGPLNQGFTLDVTVPLGNHQFSFAHWVGNSENDRKNFDLSFEKLGEYLIRFNYARGVMKGMSESSIEILKDPG